MDSRSLDRDGCCLKANTLSRSACSRLGLNKMRQSRHPLSFVINASLHLMLLQLVCVHTGSGPKWEGCSSRYGLLLSGVWSCLFRGNVIVYRAQKAIQVEECSPRRRSWPRFPLTRSCPELFRVTGPLLSLELRTEDVWQKYNHFIEVSGALNQSFPFSPL